MGGGTPQSQESTRPCLSLGNCSGIHPEDSGLVPVTLASPTDGRGGSLGEIALNGTSYPNGSEIQVRAGYNYSFTAVVENASYAFRAWSATPTYATVLTPYAPSSRVTFQCKSVGGLCQTLTLTADLTRLDHTLLGGYAMASTSVGSVNATFTVPTTTAWAPHGQVPRTGSIQVVNWGEGLGGIESASVVAVGVQIVGHVQTGGLLGSLSYQPFWATSLSGGWSSQVNLTLSGQQTVAAGDTIRTNITPTGGCGTGKVDVAISDATPHGGVNWSFSRCVSAPSSPTTGEWMGWDPFAASGGVSPSYSGGEFSDFGVNGRTARVDAPLVGASEWVPAPGSWNESLEAGAVVAAPCHLCTSVAAAFEPNVTALAGVRVAIFPYNSSDPSRPAGVTADGLPYFNGQVANLPYGEGASISMFGSGKWTVARSPLWLNFSRWYTGPGVGTVAYPTRQVTTLNVSGPGLLEALDHEMYPSSWGGYVDGVSADSASASFAVPTTTYNTTGNLTSPEAVAVWVGLGGYLNLTTDGFWQAGIDVNYTNAQGPATVTAWTLRPGLETDNFSFVARPGDRMVVSVSLGGSPGCPGSGNGCWSIMDLSQNGETWSGSMFAALNSSMLTAEWVVEAPNACSGRCAMPKFGNETFSSLTVNGASIDLLGPFLAFETWYSFGNSTHGSVYQYLEPEIAGGSNVTWCRVDEG